MTREERLAVEVQALVRLDLEGLRRVWREHWGAPPRLRSPDLLRRAMAWRLQAAAFGGLEVETARLLRMKASSRPGLSLAPGTRLTRAWQGRTCTVEVTSEGFHYDGVTYRSLSHIARIITGTRWNGRRFFGLDKAGTP